MKKYCFSFYVFSFIFLAIMSCNGTNSTPNNNPATPPKEIVKAVEGVSFKMIRVDAVKKTTLGYGCADERIVTLSAFYIGETEVTQELYKAVTGDSPSIFDGVSQGKEIEEGEIQEKRPVENINWYEATSFCNKLTEKLMGSAEECVYTFEDIQTENGKIVDAKVTWDLSKKGFRLPTECEWEYAARGGDEDVVYAGGSLHVEDGQVAPEVSKSILSPIAWYNESSGSKTHEVAKKIPNGYALYDMSGNVYEWCNDYYIKPIPKNAERDPEGPSEDLGAHTCKGGGYGVGGYSQCTVTARSPTVSYARCDDVGLRLVCRF